MKRCIFNVILFAGMLPVFGADGQQWQGTWAATAGATALAGTWSAVPGSVQNTAAGTWSLRDRNGSELATGTWAAGKEGRVWKGNWQARGASGQVYDGSWRAQIDVPAASQMSELFEAAIAQAVNGNWRMGSYAGAWTIRAYEQK